MDNKNKEPEVDPLALSSLDKGVVEDEGVDPLTLFNLTQGLDARSMGFNWINQTSRTQKKSVDDIFDDANDKLLVNTEFDQDPKSNVQEAVSGTQLNTPKLEVNAINPQVMSNEPKFNMCPAYISGSCRIDGKVCAFSNLDYKECGKYTLSTNTDPELWEINPGRENSLEYVKGIKA